MNCEDLKGILLFRTDIRRKPCPQHEQAGDRRGMQALGYEKRKEAGHSTGV